MNERAKRLLSLGVLAALTLSGSVAPMPPTAVAQADWPERVEPALLAQIQADGSTGYLVYFRERADLSPAYEMDWEARGRFVMETLQATAARSQRRVRAYLDAQGAEYQAFWIDNVIVVERSNLAIFSSLATAFAEIEALRARPQPVLFEPVEYATAPATALAVESNLAHIDVPGAWALGVTGDGIVVASIDTGVRYTHRALVNQYRGNLGGGSFEHNYHWYDPYGESPAPGDTHSHGSHVTGTMIGDDGGANQIGVAPGARWIACMGFTPSATDAGLLACGQFMVAPTDTDGNNPDPDLRPHVVNNSWGDCGNPTTYTPFYEGTVAAWHAAGIYPVFANGNTRAECPQGIDQVANPARYASATGVGALGRNNATLASYSLWGPTDQEDTINPRGYPYLKPQVSAPGTNRSALRGSDTSYGDMSGTSMATPHVAGVIALMWSAAPCLVGDYAATETILEQTATATITTGYPGHASDGPGGVPNQATGWGEVNALAAVQQAIASCGDSTLAGQVTDASTSDPIPDARVEASASLTETRSTLTALDGLYTLTLFSGTYTVTVTAYGYRPAEIAGVVVTAGVTTTQDVALEPADWYTVTGTVTDGATGWPLYARIAIDGYPGPAVWTDPVTGEYTVGLPEGIEFTFHVSAWVGGYVPAAVRVGPLTGDQVVDLALAADMVTCSAPGYQSAATRVLTEGFELAAFPPPGWTVYDADGSGQAWQRIVTIWRTGNGAARHDYGALSYAEDGWLIAPQVSLPGGSPQLRFWDYSDWPTYYGKNSVLICTSGCDTPPANYAQIATWSSVQEAWTEQVVDLSAYAGQDVRLAFRYQGTWAHTWYIDDVLVDESGCTAPTDGGLVVGNTYDADTGAPLTGVLVENDSGHTAISQDTPDDPAVDDGFYTIFSPHGAGVFTATLSGHGMDVRTVAVAQSDTVRQDFGLRSPYRLYLPIVSRGKIKV